MYEHAPPKHILARNAITATRISIHPFAAGVFYGDRRRRPLVPAETISRDICWCIAPQTKGNKSARYVVVVVVYVRIEYSHV